MTRGRIPTTEEVIQCVLMETLEVKVYYDGTIDFSFDLDKNKIRELGLNYEITEAAALDIIEEQVIAHVDSLVDKLEGIEHIEDDELDELVEIILAEEEEEEEEDDDDNK